MEYRRFGDIYAVRLDRGEEVLASLRVLCAKENIRAGFVSALGAADHAVLGLFDTKEKHYIQKTFDGPMEITSLTGNASRKEGEVYLHLHANLCDGSFRVHGGHVDEMRISATCELSLHVLDGELERRFDETIGLNLIAFR